VLRRPVSTSMRDDLSPALDRVIDETTLSPAPEPRDSQEAHHRNI